MNAGQIIDANEQFHKSALLQAAVGEQIFDELKTPKTSDSIAQHKGWSIRKTEIFLNALAALGFLSKTEGTFLNTESTTLYLTSDSSDSLEATIHHQRLQWEFWGRIPEFLKTDELVPVQQELRLKKDDAANDAFNKAMIQISRHKIPDVVSIPDFQGKKFVVDICGGHGSYLSALAQANPEMTGEVWDLETTQKYAMQTFEQDGVGDRLGFKIRDINDLSSFEGASADVCMLNDCLHYFSKEKIEDIFKNVGQILSPNGTLLVLSMTLEDDGVQPLSAAQFSFHMMLNAENGGVHPTSWIANAMTHIGLSVETRVIGISQNQTMFIGRKE